MDKPKYYAWGVLLDATPVVVFLCGGHPVAYTQRGPRQWTMHTHLLQASWGQFPTYHEALKG